MSEGRELRDRIEELQGQLKESRAELDRTRKQNEQRIRDLEELLRQAESREAEERIRADRLELELSEARTRRPVQRPSPPTRLVALMDVPLDLEHAASVLVRLAGLTAQDARLRLRAHAPVPVAILEETRAMLLMDGLRQEGLFASWCDARQAPDPARMEVRSFVLRVDALEVSTVHGFRLEVPYASMRLYLRGLRRQSIVSEPEDGPMVGHPIRKLIGAAPVTAMENLENFAWLYTDEHRFAFTQHTRYTGLGAKLPPAVSESMRVLGSVLQERSPSLMVNDRLMGRINMVLQPKGDQHQAIAELLWNALLDGWRPSPRMPSGR